MKKFILLTLAFTMYMVSSLNSTVTNQYWVPSIYKGEGEFTLYPGDVVYQPPEIHHREIEHSDDLELIEITSPSEFETVKL